MVGLLYTHVRYLWGLFNPHFHHVCKLGCFGRGLVLIALALAVPNLIAEPARIGDGVLLSVQ